MFEFYININYNKRIMSKQNNIAGGGASSTNNIVYKCVSFNGQKSTGEKDNYCNNVYNDIEFIAIRGFAVNYNIVSCVLCVRDDNPNVYYWRDPVDVVMTDTQKEIYNSSFQNGEDVVVLDKTRFVYVARVSVRSKYYRIEYENSEIMNEIETKCVTKTRCFSYAYNKNQEDDIMNIIIEEEHKKIMLCNYNLANRRRQRDE